MTAAPLELLALLIGAAAASAALVASSPRLRRAGIGVALLAAPAVVIGDVWQTERVAELREQPLVLIGAAAAISIAVAALAALFRSRPLAFCVLAIAALPLRVPVELGGETSNLLLPLYLVIAAQALVSVADGRRREQREASFAKATAGLPARALLALLAATLVAYAALSAYSVDVSNAIENAGFFLLPFALLMALLLEIDWGRRELVATLVTVAASAAVFSLVAIAQYATRDLFLNPELEQSNEIHLYFRVNSLFFDPNVLARYLALAVVAIAAFWASSELRLGGLRLAGLAGVAALSLVAMTLSFSLTSFAALIAGLAVVAVLRWQLRGALAGAAALAVALGVFAALGGLPESSLEGREVDTSGRGSLVSGGLELAEERPVAGWGSGSFGRAYYENVRETRTTVSHAEPITVAAEQGAIGLVLYAALIVASLVAVLPGAGRSAARTAIAACYAAIIVHSMGYAGFLGDPATWALLGLGLAVRRAPAPGRAPRSALAPRLPSRPRLGARRPTTNQT